MTSHRGALHRFTAAVLLATLLAGCSKKAADEGAAQNTGQQGTANTQGDIGPATVVGSTVHDGDEVDGSIDKEGQQLSYQLELAGGNQFELVDTTDGLSAMLTSGDSASPMLPGPFQFAVQKAGKATLTISFGHNGGVTTGRFHFKVVVLKPKHFTIHDGDKVSGNLQAPGQVDIYTMKTSAEAVSVVTDQSCELEYGFGGDPTAPTVRTPGQLCFDYRHPLQPGTDESVLVWSEDAKTSDYHFSLNRS